MFGSWVDCGELQTEVAPAPLHGGDRPVPGDHRLQHPSQSTCE